MTEFKIKRLGVIMQPEPGNEMEVEGVLNPAAARGPDGELYLFPRMVAKNNYSRIGIVKVKFNEAGDPVDVERLGIALEPEADYEKRPDGGGGCEDPRITYVEDLNLYIMTYTAFSPMGPRIALAQSKDLLKWERLGLASYTPYEHIEFNGINNKDACLFPKAVMSPHGHISLAMLHRPLFPGTSPEELSHHHHAKAKGPQECIWMSYSNLNADDQLKHPVKFTSHHELASPATEWEKLKIGAGTPPVLTKHGWMILYHGVSQQTGDQLDDKPHMYYAAGVMILNKDKPNLVVYRTPQPILKPDSPEEKVGIIANVVFPTGIDRRDDLGTPNRFDVYYGMADDRIGVARLDIPDELPE
jgi:predicted GH43/DUF377 family glycosyl hydrolase